MIRTIRAMEMMICTICSAVFMVISSIVWAAQGSPASHRQPNIGLLL